ncbi:MAG: cupin domain-containing protein [Actinobacteria bacterium]|nr:cupin domain-containing protein [Actinomycetota bacterium]
MNTVDLSTLELVPNFPGLRVSFPFHSGTGTAASAAVYFEVDAGAFLPTHTDSSEELLLVLEGEGEASLEDETIPLATGQMAAIPAMAPHGIRNVGDDVLRVIGFFAGSTVVHTFPDTPEGAMIFVTGAPVPIAAPLEEPAPAHA